MMRIVNAVLTPLMLGALTAGAQSSPVGDPQPNVFQEASTIALGTPTGKNLLFEARPALHLYVFNQFADKVWQKTGHRDTDNSFLKGVAMATGISFLPEIRMSTDRSSPVRTPSYRIRVTQQALWMARGDSNSDKYRISGLKLTLFSHYSNGQSGCRYRGFAVMVGAGGDSACVPENLVVAAQRTPNYDNGDFSTSYFAVAFDQRFGRAGAGEDPIVGDWEYGFEYQVHPIGLQPGGTDKEQAMTYGMHELSGHIAWERRLMRDCPVAGVLRTSLLGVARFGEDALPIKRTETELSYIFDNLGTFGFFMRYHSGFDYYNIHYYETRPFFSFGLRFDPGRLDRIATDIN